MTVLCIDKVKEIMIIDMKPNSREAISRIQIHSSENLQSEFLEGLILKSSQAQEQSFLLLTVFK